MDRDKKTSLFESGAILIYLGEEAESFTIKILGP